MEKSSKKTFQIIFYHFFALKFFQKGIVQLTSSCLLSNREINLIYKPYLNHLETIQKRLRRIDKSICFSYPVSPRQPLTILEIIGLFIEDIRIEIAHLIKAILFINTINRIHSDNFYYRDKL